MRQARTEAGLSLAGVARSDLSRTAIFLIETGKSNPTLPTLELISERTGKPLDFFLDDEPQPTGPGIDYVEIERLLAGEQFDEVIKLSGEHLDARLPRADVARLRFLKGQAHIRQADAELAAPLLSAAREHYEASGDRAMAVECLSWEVHIPFLLEDPGALAFAEAALERCRQLKPLPILTEVRILSRVAGIHAFNRNWPETVKLYQVAVEKLGPLRDLNRMAKVYGELGAAYRELGQLDLSTRYSQKSIALNEMLRDQYSTAIVENNLGLAFMNLCNYQAAEEHLGRSLEIFAGLGREHGKSNVLLSVAELAFTRGRLEEAAQGAAEALELASRTKERATEADGHLWLGKIASARGDAAQADQEFAIALSMIEKLGLTERLVRAHATYAEILEGRGDVGAAHQHLKQVVALSRPDLISAGLREERRRQFA